MPENVNDEEEFAMQAMFGRMIPPVADQGFSETVVGLVRRRIWKRRLILLPAFAIGLVVAFPVITQFLLIASNELVGLIASAEESESLGQLKVLLSLLPLRESAQTASQEIAQMSAQIDSMSWYRQYQVYILAGLMALISLVATRLIER